MKLYTEFEVKFAMDISRCQPNSTFDEVLEQLTPIELPTDEEIRKESHDYFIRGQLGFEAASDTERAFLRGILWMRDKIQGGNK